MNYNSQYGLGDIVFLKTDPEQLERMIIGVTFKCTGSLTYQLVCGTTDTDHYEIELSPKKDLLKELNISDTNKV